MIILLSPSKTMDFSQAARIGDTIPTFLSEAVALNSMLRKYKKDDLSQLLATSEKLTLQSLSEIKAFDVQHTVDNAKSAILAFSGDVYGGLEANLFTPDQMSRAGKDILILSGLYGILRGTDLIQPYRLDVSAPIVTKAGKTLYPYWKSKITQFINQYVIDSGQNMMVNLASDEYAKAIDWKLITTPVIEVDFLDEKNGVRKVISFNAKRARGVMASLIIKKKITTHEQLHKLIIDGYALDRVISTQNRLVYVK